MPKAQESPGGESITMRHVRTKGQAGAHPSHPVNGLTAPLPGAA